MKLAVCPKKGQDGVCRLGAWIRDSMAGIGTVTFYDPQTGAFAALGHGITDVDTGKLMPLSRGSVMAASVKAVILANCRGDEVCAYEIEIEKLYGGSAPTRNLLLRVTDPALIALTGGIVQGMVVSYNRDNSGEKPLRRKALRACRIGAPVRCRRGQYGTTPFLQTG